MKYFVPDIRLATELPPQRSVEDKFGGIPWGLKSDDWPKCSDCGHSQSLLAQLLHDPVRLNLGRAGRVLFVFQCNHDPGMCSTWEAGSGANACFVLEPEALLDQMSSLPADEPELEHELRVVGWFQREDGLPESLVPSFFDDDKYFALPEETLDSVSGITRLGGVPAWIQNPSEAPGPRWRFVGQLSCYHSFFVPPATEESWIWTDPDRGAGRTHCAAGPNFGDDGTAYLFLRDASPVPEGRLFWQCG
ncbi:MAG TPA: hypothetical protein VEI07_16780 [Planctomycetaceae bacterium]|nr:hypothetical protein [Planctomycetaceae bacterium]